MANFEAGKQYKAGLIITPKAGYHLPNNHEFVQDVSQVTPGKTPVPVSFVHEDGAHTIENINFNSATHNFEVVYPALPPEIQYIDNLFNLTISHPVGAAVLNHSYVEYKLKANDPRILATVVNWRVGAGNYTNSIITAVVGQTTGFMAQLVPIAGYQFKAGITKADVIVTDDRGMGDLVLVNVVNQLPTYNGLLVYVDFGVTPAA